MRSAALVWLCLGLAGQVLAQQAQPTPARPAQDTAVQASPHGPWPVLDFAHGDLDQDGQDDTILVYEASGRLCLSVLLETETASLVDSSSTTLWPQATHPYQPYHPDQDVHNAETLYMDEDTLVLRTNYAGLRTAQTLEYRLCLRQGKLRLVVASSLTRSLEGPGFSYRLDLTTGLVTAQRPPAQPLVRQQAPIYPLPTLADLRPGQEYLTDATLRSLGQAVPTKQP